VARLADGGQARLLRSTLNELPTTEDLNVFASQRTHRPDHMWGTRDLPPQLYDKMEYPHRQRHPDHSHRNRHEVP